MSQTLKKKNRKKPEEDPDDTMPRNVDEKSLQHITELLEAKDELPSALPTYAAARSPSRPRVSTRPPAPRPPPPRHQAARRAPRGPPRPPAPPRGGRRRRRSPPSFPPPRRGSPGGSRRPRCLIRAATASDEVAPAPAPTAPARVCPYRARDVATPYPGAAAEGCCRPKTGESGDDWTDESDERWSAATMNGVNGLPGAPTNGDMNGCDLLSRNQQRGCWTVGLINCKFRYLTAETFGFKINANGASLKKKQVWTLEPDSSNAGDSLIYLRSHLDKYLAVDSFGNVTCESEERDPGSQFQISVAEDGTGRWALRNVVRGYFLGASSDKLTCTAKVPGDAEFWIVHLAARPQMNLRSVGRKRFAHLSENLDEIHVDANIPWGEDTLFTLEFRQDEGGKYAIHTCNNKYLSSGGKLVDTCTADCLFAAEYHGGQLALRDRSGQYLSPIGSKAVLKTRSNTVTRDELFSLEDSLPQAGFVAALNSRFVSVKQGVDVTANQEEISDHETFQLEFDWSTKRWYIRTMQDKYWTLETGGGIQAAGDKRSSNALFDLVWQQDGSVAFRANNGRFVTTKRSGHLYANADTADDDASKYFFYLVNRPILVLKSEQGFVGYKSAGSPKLECNKATYETIQVERGDRGVVYFKGQNNKYWHVDSEGVTCDSDTSEGFYLELREPTRLCIKTASGNYLTATKNGCFRLGDNNVESATLWEY